MSARSPSIRLALIVVTAVIWTALPGTGWSESDTGRRPGPTTSKPDDADTRWWFAVGGGVMTSGDLFKVVVQEGIAFRWSTPAGGTFQSDKFTATLDEEFVVVCAAGLRLGSRISLRADLSWARLPVTAEARAGETVELYPYDELSFLLFGLVAEGRLISTPSYPYLLAGAILVAVDSAGASEFDQTRFAPRFGVGYNQYLGRRWSLRFEVRDTLTRLDSSSYRPQVVGPVDPNITFTEVSVQNLFELLVQAKIGF